MSVFNKYSSYYNLLYKDKDYTGESDYVAEKIFHSVPSVKSVLELGCGTGIHAALLARKGWRVHGIDLSESMIASAEANRSGLSDNIASLLSFDCGDVRNYRYKDHFDAVMSLFHVASYQTSNKDLDNFISTAAVHLPKGGVFVFDFWYGPAVLTNLPEVRVKRLDDEKVSLVRIAEPDFYPNLNRVDVNYHILITDKNTGLFEEVKETHPMRYLFLPEVSLLLEKHGFVSWTAEEWMTRRSPSSDTWGVCVAAIK